MGIPSELIVKACMGGARDVVDGCDMAARDVPGANTGGNMCVYVKSTQHAQCRHMLYVTCIYMYMYIHTH